MTTADALVRLDDRVVIITGAAGGQGVAHARLLHALGARLVLTDVVEEALGALAAEFGDDAIALLHDTTDPEAWARVVRAATEAFGRVDVLVNNAGVSPEGPLVDVSPEAMRRTIEVNLVGPMLGMQAVADAMARTGGGSIVNIASTAGLRGYANRVIYSSSKFGLRGATHSAAHEFGSLGIRVNTICPGSIDTPMASAASRAGTGFITTIPIARIGRPDEISSMVAFLASDASSYCTGQDFVVDGGQVA